MKNLQNLEALGEMNPDALTADGFDAACIGFTCGNFKPNVAVYDRAKCLLELIGQGMTEEEAEEFFSFNVEGSWVGENGPLYIELWSDFHGESSEASNELAGPYTGRPHMQQSNNLIFDSSATPTTGAWLNIGSLTPTTSLHIVGLEAGGSLTLQLSNAATVPAANDTNHVALAPIAAITGGAPQLIAGPSLPAQWLRVLKTPGTTPTETTVKMFGQIL